MPFLLGLLQHAVSNFCNSRDCQKPRCIGFHSPGKSQIRGLCGRARSLFNCRHNDSQDSCLQERNPEGVVVRFGAEAAIGDGRKASFNQEAPVVTWFSSRGPDIINSNQEAADVMKPDILAPGYLIWAAWSPYSIVDRILRGYNFALLSGTSMATPHIAGIAALIKQLNPSWSPAMIASAMITTASRTDNKGKPIMALGSNISHPTPATPFDYGGGFINATAALDPGLVFQAEFEDYMSFLCSLPNVNAEAVKAATGQSCTATLQWPSDLNLPSITVSRLIGSRTVKRTVTNVGQTMEYFEASVVNPRGVEVRINPSTFTIESGESQEVNIEVSVSEAINVFSFGEIVFTGDENHVVRMPLSVLPVSSFSPPT